MKNMNEVKRLSSCRTCMNYYSCDKNLDNLNVVCAYYVARYNDSALKDHIIDLLRRSKELEQLRQRLLAIQRDFQHLINVG